MNKWFKYSALSLVITSAVFFLLNAVFPLKVNTSYSTMVMSREGDLMMAFLSKDDKWRMKCSVKELPPELLKAFIYKEDRYFYFHPGINPFSMIRAAFNNVVYHKRTSGASTITMQVVRLLEPRQRTISSKIIESFRALQLEMQYSKDEILALYLDLVPYGSNIEGVQAASWLYFGKNLNLLSDAQMVTLVVIPNKPTSLKPGKNNDLLVFQRNKWLHHFFDEKFFIIFFYLLPQPFNAIVIIIFNDSISYRWIYFRHFVNTITKCFYIQAGTTNHDGSFMF